jgi:transglutaminase-like putative cysteine protease
MLLFSTLGRLSDNGSQYPAEAAVAIHGIGRPGLSTLHIDTWPEPCAKYKPMRIRVGCEFSYESEAAVHMLMLVRAKADAEQHTEFESRWTEPRVAVREYVDAYGNLCWRFTAPAGTFRIRYDALVTDSGRPDVVIPDAALTAVEDLPDSTLVFTLPSRYVQSDLLVPMAWQLFGDTPATWARVQAVCDWVHSNIAYAAGSSDPTVTASDILQRRVGVCRDFALLAVAFCRALNIPARYTFGYLPDIAVDPPDTPMDFHAWFEAYVGGRWHAFDARHNEPRIGRVVIGRGRDAIDVALTTQYGGSRLQQMTVWADEVAADLPRDDDADELEAAERTISG